MDAYIVCTIIGIQVYGVENTVMVDRSWYSVLRVRQLRQDEGNARAMSDGICVGGCREVLGSRRGLTRVYGGRGVNGYMLDCESGVAGSIPVDHPMGVWANWLESADLKFAQCGFESHYPYQTF